jgi:hypothetical protein
MYVLFNPDDVADLRAVGALWFAAQAPGPPSAPSDPDPDRVTVPVGQAQAGSASERFVDAAWRRLGCGLRTILKASQEFYPGEFNLHQLAERLGQPYASVRASVNSGLKRVIRKVQSEQPDAPDHFWIWRQCDDGHWEASLSEEMLNALARRSVDDPRR